MADSSWQNSGLTFDDPTRFVDQEEESSLDVIGRDTMSVQWTDEKHSLYITSMEASFVEQLYNSKDSFGWRARTKSRVQGQVKHLRSRPDPQPEAYARDNVANSRNKHFRVRGKTEVASSSVQHNKFYTNVSSGEYNYFPTNCNEEVSDQNFVEGSYEPDIASER